MDSKAQVVRQTQPFAFEKAPDSDVYLLTGEMVSAQGEVSMAIGYAIAQSSQEAASAQLQSEPSLRLTGVVSLADLKEQVRLLEGARSGALPVLAVGHYAQSLARQSGAAL